jgi:hypothetical protein
VLAGAALGSKSFAIAQAPAPETLVLTLTLGPFLPGTVAVVAPALVVVWILHRVTNAVTGMVVERMAREPDAMRGPALVGSPKLEF